MTNTEPTTIFTALDDLIKRWSTIPALRKGTSATELKDTMESSIVTTLSGLLELPKGTKLYSRRTGHFWVLEPLESPVFATGTGGGYSLASEFYWEQGGFFIMSVPEK